jgi:two-component system response regulator FlrC
VLQEHEIDRVGGKLPVPIDVRVIATTNVDVNKAIVEGRFRKDLYYRLNVIPVNIPPLRARLDDLPSLTEHFVEKYVRLHGRRDLRITPSFLRALRQHDWPGNVRELENVVQRAVLLAGENGLTPDCLLLDGKPAESSSSIELMPISAMERLLIHKALGSCQGNRTRAAEILGISVRTLRNKLHEYRQDPLATALPADPEHA